MRDRILQIKLVKEKPPEGEVEQPQDPGKPPEEIVGEVIQQTVAMVVVGYTVCKSVDFFFRMAEHVIVNKV